MLPVILSGEILVDVNCHINIILICPSQLYIPRNMLHVCDCIIHHQAKYRNKMHVKCHHNTTLQFLFMFFAGSHITVLLLQ